MWMYNDFPLFKREDSDVFIRKDTQEGWVCCDENGIISGKVWSLSDAQNSEFPPEWDWVSMKWEKSYVYVLEYN